MRRRQLWLQSVFVGTLLSVAIDCVFWRGEGVAMGDKRALGVGTSQADEGDASGDPQRTSLNSRNEERIHNRQQRRRLWL